MSSRLHTRLRRLEAYAQEPHGPVGEGLSGFLASWRTRDTAMDAVPVAALTDAELHEQLTALAGARGLSLLLQETLEVERTQRQAALTKDLPT